MIHWHELTPEKMQELGVKKYRNPVAGFTHWFMDPETDEPVPIIVVEDKGRLLKICDPVVEAFAKSAEGSGRWAFYLMRHEGSKNFLDRVTNDFPRSEFKPCEELIRLSNIEDTGPIPEEAKPKAAAFDPKKELSDRVKMFEGSESPDDE